MYSESGQQEAARTEVAAVRKISPALTLTSVRQRAAYEDQAVLERILDNLREAGLE